MATDHHLLVGLLALQNGLIQPPQLVAAFHAWTSDKARSLADHLVILGHLNAAQRSVVEALADLHVAAHGGEVERSLAAVSVGRSTRESLAALGDPDIQATLGHVTPIGGATAEGDADRTASYGAATVGGDGQRFRVLRPHAQGGLGAVFVALDGELNREVALKQILERHADDPVSRQRFLLEAEVTGGLEHPGIVPVYGLGRYADGRPYYAMRFVRGDSLKEAIERFQRDEALRRDPGGRSLELRQLLRRFTDVCYAIEYAHSRGVLHRDIKPGNVIVGKHGETLVVDWGLAKATGHAEPGSGERTLMPSSASGSAETLPGSAMGTPGYMSPEQARGDLEVLGPRSDVYSLGATLYCVLTGQVPFEGDDIGAVLRAVQRGDVRPPRALDPSIDPALEAVCVKAMALRVEERYFSARLLAQDIERWMADEPVTARRETFTERARRWVRRRRTAATAAAAAVIVAILGLASVVGVQTHANGELRAANARERAQFELAMQAIGKYHDEVSQDVLLKQAEFKQLRERLLEGAIDFYRRLEELLGGSTDPRSLRALAQAYQGLGAVLMQMDRPYERGHETIGVFEKARRARGALAYGPQATVEDLAEFGRAVYAQFRARWAFGAGDHEALPLARSIFEDLAARFPDNPRYRFDLAVALMNAQVAPDLDRARSLLEGVVAEAPGVPRYKAELARCHFRFGSRSEPPDRRLAHLARARDLLEELVASDGKSIDDQSELAAVCASMGGLQADLGRTDDAILSRRRALETWEGLASAYPVVRSYRVSVITSLRTLGGLLIRAGRGEEGRAAFDRAFALADAIGKEAPLDGAGERFETLLAMGDADRETGRVAKARTAYRTAMEVADAAGAPLRGSAQWPASDVARRRLISLLRDRSGFRGEVLEAARWSLDHALKQNEETRRAIGWRREVARAQLNLGVVDRVAGREADALALLARACELQGGITMNEPAARGSARDLGQFLTEYGSALREAGRLPEARGALARAVTILEELSRGTDDRSFRLALADSQRHLALLLDRTGQPGEARRLLREAAANIDRITTGQLAPRQDESTIADIAIDLAVVEARDGDRASARSRCRRVLDRLEHLPSPDLRELYCIARARAQLAGLSDPETGAGPPRRLTGALEALRTVVAGGFRAVPSIRTDTALDPLRSLPEFPSLMADVDFPEDPFAP